MDKQSNAVLQKVLREANDVRRQRIRAAALEEAAAIVDIHTKVNEDVGLSDRAKLCREIAHDIRTRKISIKQID